MSTGRMAGFAVLLLSGGVAGAGPIITGTYDAATLANAISGPGITISNAKFTTSGAATLPAAAGTFTGGAPSVGFDSGIVLTTGTVECAGGSNTEEGCGLDRGGDQGDNEVYDVTSLSFDFTSDTGNVFFQYVFGSEEYNEFVDSEFNDQFELLLNGVNIALLPGAGGVVSINNVNCTSNAGFYRNNSAFEAPQGCNPLGLDIQFDGLTVLLTASGALLAGLNTFEFRIFDRGDGILDSGVFIRAGSFSSTDPVPEPGTLALLGVGLAALGLSRRRKAA